MAARLRSPQVRVNVNGKHVSCYRDSLPSAVRGNGLMVSAKAYSPVRPIRFTVNDIKKAPDLRQRLDMSGQRLPGKRS